MTDGSSFLAIWIDRSAFKLTWFASFFSLIFGIPLSTMDGGIQFIIGNILCMLRWKNQIE